MHKRTKKTAIPKEVKRKAWERDGEHCIICGHWVPVECSCAHFIGRAQGGLGIEENILTLCDGCHRQYDNGLHRQDYKDIFTDYLQTKYEGWSEDRLKFDKWRDVYV